MFCSHCSPLSFGGPASSVGVCRPFCVALVPCDGWFLIMPLAVGLRGDIGCPGAAVWGRAGGSWSLAIIVFEETGGWAGRASGCCVSAAAPRICSAPRCHPHPCSCQEAAAKCSAFRPHVKTGELGSLVDWGNPLLVWIAVYCSRERWR